MSVETLQQSIIDKILNVRDTSKLQQIEASISDLSPTDDILQQLHKPMRKRLDIEALKREQNFQPIDKEAFFKKIDDLNVEESLEDLLEMI